MVTVFAARTLERPLQPLDAVRRCIGIRLEPTQAQKWIEIHAHFTVFWRVRECARTLIKDRKDQLEPASIQEVANVTWLFKQRIHLTTKQRSVKRRDTPRTRLSPKPTPMLAFPIALSRRS